MQDPRLEIKTVQKKKDNNLYSKRKNTQKESSKNTQSKMRMN